MQVIRKVLVVFVVAYICFIINIVILIQGRLLQKKEGLHLVNEDKEDYKIHYGRHAEVDFAENIICVRV